MKSRFNEDLTIKQLDNNPLNNWCDSGHEAPAFFKRDGKDGNLEPTRFFRVVGSNIDKTICEPCLIISRHIANLKKKEKLEEV